jgi:hypothetical protein
VELILSIGTIYHTLAKVIVPYLAIMIWSSGTNPIGTIYHSLAKVIVPHSRTYVGTIYHSLAKVIVPY